MSENGKSSEQKKEFMKAVKSAKTIEDMVKALQDFYDGVSDPEMFGMANKLYHSNPDLALLFCVKASTLLIHFECYFHLNAFSDVNSPLFDAVLSTLGLAGAAFSKVRMFDESLDFLTRASEIGDISYHCFDDHSPMLSVLSFVEKELGTLKFRMGLPDEKNVPHFRKSTDIQERYSDEYDIELGHSCMNLALGYVKLRDFKQALPFCLKAVKIFTKNFGINSEDVAAAKRYLGIIRGSLRNHENA